MLVLALRVIAGANIKASHTTRIPTWIIYEGAFIDGLKYIHELNTRRVEYSVFNANFAELWCESTIDPGDAFGF